MNKFPEPGDLAAKGTPPKGDSPHEPASNPLLVRLARLFVRWASHPLKIIIAFLMFEPDGLAHRWRQIKTYWKLYPFSH